jgi:hypothetical protein
VIPFVGFLPDLDEHSEGIITDCTMMLPTLKGYKGAPSLTTITDALAAACVGAVYVVKLDNTTRQFAGTATKLYELDGTSWTDVSRVGDYTNTTEWRFVQYGNVTLAVNMADTMQKSVSTGAFSDLAGAPKAAVIEAVAGFVMVANYNDGTDTPDGIFWSAFEDYTDWTPDVATQCGNLRKFDTPGEFRALKRLGDYAVAYKEKSMYLGVNNGPPTLWGFTLVSGEIGAVSQEAVVSIETAHFFISQSDIFVYDGARPVSIGDGIREWFFADLNANYAYKIRGVHDRNNALIYWYYPSTGSTGALDSCIVFNYKSKKWSRANRSIEVCLEYLTGAFTYASAEAYFATYADADGAGLTYGSPFWTATSPNMAIFGTDHILKTLDGASVTSSVTTGAVGDDSTVTFLSRVQARYINDPTSATMTNYYRMTDGSSYTTDATVTESSGRFDVLRSARWHKAKLSFSGDVEIVGLNYKIQPDGEE